MQGLGTHNKHKQKGEHMAWTNGNTPHTTAAQRKRIMARDNRQCQIHGPQCQDTATEVDHIDNTRNEHYNTDSNLQAVCSTCHKAKTQSESYARRWYKRTKQPSIGQVERARKRV